MAGSVTPLQFIDLGLPMGESQDLLSAESASLIQNMAPHNEGGLRSISGPCSVEPDRGNGYPSLGEAHGVFQTNFSGVYDMLLFRMGSNLYEHRGWTRSFVSLVSGLTDERRPSWPDQFARVADTVVWINGTDRARLIMMNGHVIPLGFDRAPSAPTVDGPESPTEGDKLYFYPNAFGVSWPGSIGTAGEVLNDNDGKLLSGKWTCKRQLQDEVGNRSPWSVASAEIDMDEIVVKPYRFAYIGGFTADNNASGTDISDVYRRFVYTMDDTGTAHHTRTNIARTENQRYKGNTHNFCVSYEGSSISVVSDGMADGALGQPVVDVEPVPIFRVMCVHDGSLVVANTPTDACMVMRSERGYAGTLLTSTKTRLPDVECTALHSHNGKLYAFAQSQMFLITDKGPLLIDGSVGAAGPNVVQSLDDGSMVWLGYDTVYRMVGDNVTVISEAIAEFLALGLNKARMKMASSWVDPTNGTCYWALADAGAKRNRYVIGWHRSAGWSRLDYDVIGLAGVCVSNGIKPHIYAAATLNDTGYALVLNRSYIDFTVPPRNAIYRTRWLRVDPLMRKKFTFRDVHISFLETGNYQVTVNIYRDQIETPAMSATMYLYDLPFTGTDSPINASLAEVGTSIIRKPRIATRWLSVNGPGLEGITDVRCAMIEIVAAYPAKLHLMGLSVSWASGVSAGEWTGRIPMVDATS
mgnify:CR=1 FL=1